MAGKADAASGAGDLLPAGEVVHVSDFGKAAPEVWSNRQLAKSPSGRQFLGQFDNEEVTLSLEKLPGHRFVKVTADVLILESWDGAPSNWGPDVWQLRVVGGPVLMRTTFDFAEHRRQAYPDCVPLINHAGGSGATEKGKLGYKWEQAEADYVYRIEAVFPHEGTTLRLGFGAEGLEDKSTESWGLENVRVEVYDRPPSGKLTGKQMAAMWEALSGEDAAAAQRAVWRFVGAGEPGRAFLEKKLAEMLAAAKQVDPAPLIRQLDSTSFREREEATEKLIELGRPVLEPVREAMRESKSVEVRSRAERIIEAIESRTEMGALEVRARWALGVLAPLKGSGE